MNIYTIYKATNNINGKVYIGFDSNWPNRKTSHKRNYKKRNIKFYSSIKKYGWDNFEWEVIYMSKDGEHCLKIMEPFFIESYNSYHNGYNMTLGGEGTLGLNHTERHKKYLSDINKIIQKSPNIKKAKSDWAHDAWNKGVFDKSCLNFIVVDPTGVQQKINNLRKFCRNNSLSQSAMVAVAKGKYKQHHGWKCFYA
jgi:group I intron endonuclease